MKKAFASIFIVLAVLICLPAEAFAAELSDTTKTVYQPDGSYIVYETIVSNSLVRTVRSAQQTGTGYDSDGNKVFALVLKASFSYNGSTSECTQAGCTYTIYKSGWKKDSATSSRSGDTAYADGYFSSNSGGESEVHLSLTCDPDGNIS